MEDGFIKPLYTWKELASIYPELNYSRLHMFDEMLPQNERELDALRASMTNPVWLTVRGQTYPMLDIGLIYDRYVKMFNNTFTEPAFIFLPLFTKNGVIPYKVNLVGHFVKLFPLRIKGSSEIIRMWSSFVTDISITAVIFVVGFTGK